MSNARPIKVLINVLNFAAFFFVYVMIKNVLEVKLGFVRGAAAAQWEFVLVLLPIPFILGLITVALSVANRSRLSRFYLATSFLMMASPILCWCVARYIPYQ
ncbi:hypothetical protein A3715_18760 [Oleiphilus sp. HI0009]|nr:hypothetical protein A3715_12020 [Oleiphilus sp. HI0009]KZX81964.1 hypothetical protein A3715_18760 [Oleiphilus sp. HI0009]KZY66788.1 hypothetical protein A3738_16325 [Oleiphilus sp. HI0066]KZY69195.1 hypothetical protein A3739_09490 [Oleiphilus sp. HI0067]